MKFRSFLMAAVAVVLLFTTNAGAVSLEQIQPVMPQIDVYIRDGDTALDTLTAEDITATLDDTSLRVTLLEPSEQGVFYIFMLDISRSISEAHLVAARQAVMNTYQQMGQSDQLALISFGNEVNVLLQGNESANQVQAALDSIHSTDNNTRFYDAMNALVETASSQNDMRRVAVVVSDGVDDTDAGMTRDELIEVLRQSGVAVYAMAVDSAAEATRNQFREFIQVSGGDLFTFSPSNAMETLDDLQSSIDEIWHLQLMAESNVADGLDHNLNIQFGELDNLSVEVRPTRWTPDSNPPYLVSSTPDSANGTVTLTFNEAIANIDDPQCYTLTDASGKEVPFSILSFDATQVVLQSSEQKNLAECSLSLKDLKDASMEANVLAPCTTQIANAQGSDPSTGSADEQADANGDLMQLLLPVGGALVLVILLVALLLAKKRGKTTTTKKAKKEKSATPVNFIFENDDKHQE